jgi:two-component system CheB/CheR fusion protein
MAIETGRESIDSASIKLVVSMPERPVYIDADLTRTAQIFLNVLNNAAKFSFPGDLIDVAVRVENSDVVITIRDTGRGIAPESLSKIFEMFGQIEPLENRELGGLGIGLSIVKQLTEMHGGSVSVSSEGIGHGSEFVIRLPLAADQEAAEVAVSIDAPVPVLSSAHKILVVDDNRDAAEMLETLLTLQGHSVTVSFESTRAIDVARDFAPAICLLDIGMPEMDGYDLARQLRMILPDVLLISVSGWGQEQDRIRSREAGFDHHFVKPVEFNALLDVIAEHGQPEMES